MPRYYSGAFPTSHAEARSTMDNVKSAAYVCAETQATEANMDAMRAACLKGYNPFTGTWPTKASRRKARRVGKVTKVCDPVFVYSCRDD